ncbi:MAG: hypothetical protein EA385_03630 [Salinarimonadaceae bacterium]|nr:MAG: hypothetical protein EA385_03630 [Salinarimonadaceae bacterium]
MPLMLRAADLEIRRLCRLIRPRVAAMVNGLTSRLMFDGRAETRALQAGRASGEQTIRRAVIGAGLTGVRNS